MNAASRRAVILVTILAAGCAASREQPETAERSVGTPAFEVAVGSGGGFAGTWRTVRMREDGTLVVEFSTTGRSDAEVPAGRLDEAARRAAWDLVKDGIGALGCEPGNMTDRVETRIAGVEQRACAPMDQGSARFRKLHDELERIIATPAAGVQPPPPPLPPLPLVLVVEASREATRHRVARVGPTLPAPLDQDTHRLDDEAIDPIWRAIFSSRFYSGASIEERDGVALPGAPFPCGKDMSVRVTSGDGATWETRQRCAEGDAEILALADLVIRAAGD